MFEEVRFVLIWAFPAVRAVLGITPGTSRVMLPFTIRITLCSSLTPEFSLGVVLRLK